ncbi:MAG: sulfurtransferase TusA family protein [Euryarchaeota archaeon]|nr:sulfurtransferase TusA family protein [Euryarchaeota archaeon]
MALRDEKPTITVDVKGKVCPYPLLETKLTLKKMKSGEILEVIVDTEAAVKTSLPNLCQKEKHEFDCIEKSPGVWNIYIKKA